MAQHFSVLKRVTLKDKNSVCRLRGHMHHLADSMTELCHSGKHNNAGGESIPMYYSSGEGA